MDLRILGFLFISTICLVATAAVATIDADKSAKTAEIAIQPTEISTTVDPTEELRKNIPQLGAHPDNPKDSSIPYIDPSTPYNVSAVLGKTAFLTCRISNLSEKSLCAKVLGPNREENSYNCYTQWKRVFNEGVSWVRHRDVQVLAVSTYVYTSDLRFTTFYEAENEEWILRIKPTERTDEGVYECQISTMPITRYLIYLYVVLPSAVILGFPDLYVDRGSAINLTCVVNISIPSDTLVLWYHQNRIISYDSPRGGVSIYTDKNNEIISYLFIQDAKESDTGTYQCSPSNAEAATIEVHILNAEEPAAMQTGEVTEGKQDVACVTKISGSLFLIISLVFVPLFLLQFQPVEEILMFLQG